MEKAYLKNQLYTILAIVVKNQKTKVEAIALINNSQLMLTGEDFEKF